MAGRLDSRLLKGAALAVLLLLHVLVAILVGTAVVNNLRMNDWKREVFDAPRPPGVVVVSRGSEYGLLEGNGNHCDKRAWMVLRGASTDALEKHYTRLLETPDRWVTSIPGEEGLVRIEVYEIGLNAGWDLRCH